MAQYSCGPMPSMKSTRGNSVLIGFIEAESEMDAALSNRIDDEIVCVTARQVASWRAALGPTSNEARVVRWLTKALLHRKRAKVIHPGVRRVKAFGLYSAQT